MSAPPKEPVRLASEDVIISAPMSYSGSAQRIIRLRRHADGGRKLVAITVLAILLIVVIWALVTVWYLTWGLLLIPYRVLRRSARKRKLEALRHRELMGTIQGSAAASAATIVARSAAAQAAALAPASPKRKELIGDAQRGAAVDELRGHMLAGRLTTDELEVRVAEAHRARTWADLEAALIDLPRDGANPADARADRTRWT
ncbi:MAG: DUF1707 SHOCT-like domain-containing protein [Solirubrobacteraceae bacterium]